MKASNKTYTIDDKIKKTMKHTKVLHTLILLQSCLAEPYAYHSMGYENTGNVMSKRHWLGKWQYMKRWNVTSHLFCWPMDLVGTWLCFPFCLQADLIVMMVNGETRTKEFRKYKRYFFYSITKFKNGGKLQHIKKNLMKLNLNVKFDIWFIQWK